MLRASSVRLYGKDGEDGHPLDITAEVDFTLELGSKCLCLCSLIAPRCVYWE